MLYFDVLLFIIAGSNLGWFCTCLDFDLLI